MARCQAPNGLRTNVRRVVSPGSSREQARRWLLGVDRRQAVLGRPCLGRSGSEYGSALRPRPTYADSGDDATPCFRVVFKMRNGQVARRLTHRMVGLALAGLNSVLKGRRLRPWQSAALDFRTGCQGVSTGSPCAHVGAYAHRLADALEPAERSAPNRRCPQTCCHPPPIGSGWQLCCSHACDGRRRRPTGELQREQCDYRAEVEPTKRRNEAPEDP